jgi:hypothetical protein
MIEELPYELVSEGDRNSGRLRGGGGISPKSPPYRRRRSFGQARPNG